MIKYLPDRSNICLIITKSTTTYVHRLPVTQPDAWAYEYETIFLLSYARLK